MDILRHLEGSARQLGVAGERLSDYVLAFTVPSGRGYRREVPCSGPPDRALRATEHLLRLDGFDVGAGADFEGGRVAGRWESVCERNEGWLAHVPGLAQRELPLRFEVEGRLSPEGLRLTVSHDLRSWLDSFAVRLQRELVPVVREVAPLAALGPGESLPERRDYSACAQLAEVGDLRRGALPLGRWRFGAEVGPELFLERALENQGMLVCAPQNSGKTRLIVRWTEAAMRSGLNSLVLDVKGNLLPKLPSRGKVLHFTTDPTVACHRLNLLAGLDLAQGRKRPDGTVQTDPQVGARLRQLVAALLPDDDVEGEQRFYHDNQVKWLTALVHLLKLRELYFPQAFPGRGVDLSDLYTLVSCSDDLHNVLHDNFQMEAWRRQHGGVLPSPGTAYWHNELLVLLDPDRELNGRRGRRTAEHPFETLTLAMQNALRPFSEHGGLYRKIRDVPTWPEDEPFRNFRLEELDSTEPVTLVLAAREQDVEEAETVLALVMRRLQQLLFDRFAGDPGHRPILLLLDETRRIRGFKPAEYVSYAREARAGCVLVYQALDQIGEEAAVLELLENVGTQIYLKAVTGRSVEHLVRVLPRRWRATVTQTATRGSSGVSEATQTGQELVEAFSSYELAELPAGRWPGLVCIRGRKPILVDLEERHGQA